MLDLNAVLIFVKVAETGSFSEAARRLKMPISTVSRRVAELENQLAVRLLDRTTRRLRLTDVGNDVFEQARRAADVSEMIDGLVSDQRSEMSGMVRLAAPPSISDTLLSPITVAFESAHPDVRVEIMITEKWVDPVSEGIDLIFHVGPLADSGLVARRMLTFRHQLVASPAYVESFGQPSHPRDLLDHRILAFSHFRAEHRWTFTHTDGGREQVVSFHPHLAINDFTGVTSGLLAGIGVGDLSPLVQPDLLRSRKLIPVMPDWQFPKFDLSLVHLANRHLPRQVRAFKDAALTMAPEIFPDLPV